VGEFVWYASGSDDVSHIEAYIPNYGKNIKSTKTSSGGYGPRLFGRGAQIPKIIELLRLKPSSRQAVVQLFDADDLQRNRADVPCTCTLQFFIRGGALELHTHMRSNDAYLGLPHDIFSFTMIQEYVANLLNLDLGPYFHTVGSLHLYDRHMTKVSEYLQEGVFEPQHMPRMPGENVDVELAALVELEARVRAGQAELADLPNGYWGDLARILYVQRSGVLDGEDGDAVRNALTYDYFSTYISDIQYRTAREELGEERI
jgi:thymidylate synthase